jgi:iron complex transport system ATP-binding protein
VLALEGATVCYPGTAMPQLDGATFAVRAGECVAIVGPNGSGKTTALRALLGIAPLSRGAARILGKDLGAWERTGVARTVAAVAQREEPAFPISVREAVAMGRYPHLGPWRSAAAADRDAVQAAMRRADIEMLADRWVQTLSGGEWQRVRLARALAQQPRALVLDEPTASLDLRHEMELFELVTQLARQDGLAALVVTHHLNAAARFADQLVLMANGRVIATGPAAEVLEPARLSRVFGWPIALHHLPDGSIQLHPERLAR